MKYCAKVAYQLPINLILPPMRVLLFDNYDSFTYNLVHLVEKIVHFKIEVFRNDKIRIEEVGKYDKIILSPGPGLPSESGILIPLIKEYASTKPILGVCLGHQAIAQAFGGELFNLPTVYHGVATNCNLDTDCKLFKGLPPQIQVGRYHSWAVKKDNFPPELEITATV